MFAALGAATGLGNAFRFPALCAQYGAAFIAVYALSLITVCYPLLCAELALGKAKNFDKNGGGVWRIIFCAAAANSALIAAYYGVIASKLASASAGFIAYASPNPPDYSAVFAVVAVCAVACLLLIKGQSALDISGRLSVCLSFALFLPLAGIGLGSARLSFDTRVLLCGGAWADGLGQSLLSLSLAAGVMPTFARSLPENFSPAKTAGKITAVNFCGCVVAAFATLPFTDGFAQGGGVACAFTVFPQVVFAVAKSPLSRRIFGAFAYACLCAVAVHSLCSLAYPLVGALARKFKFFPAIFCVLCAVLAPVFAANNCEILNACDRVACSVSAVIIAFAESLYIAKTAHIRGVTAVFVRFICPVCCAFVVVLSLCSARFIGLSPAAIFCAAGALTVPLCAAGANIKILKNNYNKQIE